MLAGPQELPAIKRTRILPAGKAELARGGTKAAREHVGIGSAARLPHAVATVVTAATARLSNQAQYPILAFREMRFQPV